MRALHLLIGVLGAALSIGAQAPAEKSCAQVGKPVQLPAVPEASGVAHAAGALWTHNDSGPAVLFRLDDSGKTTRVAVAGATVDDWEDLVSAPCPAGACLYIGDIGDNNRTRQHLTIYQVPAPASGSASTPPATASFLRYADHPHDAEALVVTRHRTFVITKEVPPSIYHVQTTALKAGETATLTRLRTLNEKERITGAAVSPDERWVVLRSKGSLLVYAMDDFLKGGDAVRVDLVAVAEPQGEGVTFGRDGELLLVSEGGGKKTAGMLTRLHCAFIR